MSPLPASGSEGPVVLTVQQTAMLLQVSENHVYNLVSEGSLPHVRFGKLIRIPHWGLLQYIAAASGAPLNPGVAMPPESSVYDQQPNEEEE